MGVRARLQIPARHFLGPARLAGLLLGATIPAQALAQDAPLPAASSSVSAVASLTRVVNLRNGSVVQGRLMAEVPGQYLLLQLPQGGSMRLEWGDIAAIRVAESSTGASSIEAYDPRAVEANVVGEPKLRLSARLSNLEAGEWEPICQLPCLRVLSREYKYRVEGPDFSARGFRLPDRGTRVRVQVRSGSRAGFAAGATLLALGAPVTASGVGLLFAGFIGAIFGGSDLWKYGAPLALIGPPMIITGVVVLGRSSAEVKVIPGPEGSAALQLPLSKHLWLTQSGLAF